MSEKMSDAEIARARAKTMRDSMPWSGYYNAELPEDEWKTDDEISWLNRLADASDGRNHLRVEIERLTELLKTALERERLDMEAMLTSIDECCIDEDCNARVPLLERLEARTKEGT